MIRRGYYGKYKGKIYKITVSSNNIVYVLSNNDNDFGVNGFVKNMNYEKHPKLDKYYATITQEEIEWFCEVSTKGNYKGYEVWIDGDDGSTYAIRTNPIPLGNKIFTKENGFGQFDRQVYIGNVPKSEVTNIVEIKEPILGYKAPDNWDF